MRAWRGGMAALLWMAGQAAAATWTVATNGSDATGTGSLEQPFRTVAYALQQAEDGDAVELRGGTYREAGEVRFRGPGVTLRSRAGEWAVLEAPVDNEDDFSVCVLIDPDADGTTLSRLEIAGGFFYGVMLQTKWDWGDPDDREGACRVTIEDCVIRDTGRDGIKITPNCDDVLIERCEIYRTGVGPANEEAENAEGIDCVNGDRVTVRDCDIHDVFSTGVYLKGGSTDGLVERTRVSRCGGAGIMLGFDTSPEYFDLGANPGYYENIRGTVRNCLVRDTGWEGIGMYAALNPAVLNNTLANVCTGNVHAALYFGLTYQDWDAEAGRPASVDPIVFNNLIAQPAGFSDETFEIRHSGDLGGMSALAGWPRMDCNGYYMGGGGAARFTDNRPGSTLNQGTLEQWRAHAGTDGRSRTNDPQFVDAGGSNWALRAGSPYIDAGSNAAWMGAATDLEGESRIVNAVVDAGAYEYRGGAFAIDHRHVDVTQLTQARIERAKEVLHIGYGHTSHGSQLTDGMSGLVGFANGGGKGLARPENIFAWNNGGAGGALDLEEGAGYDSGWLELDGGYWPTWANETREYLDDPSHADVNVIVWSWCGQMSGKYSGGTLTNQYLAPMAALEAEYPGVTFVYMTGHVDIWDDAANKAACAAIRNWCSASNRVLYDFNDIEHWDPDGTYYEFVNDDCAVHADAGGEAIGNWATAWQGTHAEGVDWYECGSAHSEPLNANQKAYAAWALWCRLAERIAGEATAWDEGYQELGGGWRRLGWFGDYAPMGSEGWIWHNKHGFLFVAPNAAPGDAWAYANDMGWLWTGNETYPFMYRSNDGAWLWYNGATNPRWFRNMTAGTWESRP